MFGCSLLNTTHRPFALTAWLTLPLLVVSGEATLTNLMWLAAEADALSIGASASTHPRTPVSNTHRRMRAILPRHALARNGSAVPPAGALCRRQWAVQRSTERHTAPTGCCQ